MPRKKRLSPNQIAELDDDFAGLKSIPDYNPVKEEFKVSEIEPVKAALAAKNDEISQKEAEISELRGEAADIGGLYVKKMKGARQQIVAQYGDDSPEYEAVGGTRTSNRRRSARRGTGGNTPNS